MIFLKTKNFVISKNLLRFCHRYDATMAVPADSSTKDKLGWMKGEFIELKLAGKTVDELKEIVRKNLVKSPTYYVENAAFGIKGIGYTKNNVALGEPQEAKGKYKASGYGDLPKKK